jgi:glutamyl-tRNA synthetase
MAISHVIRGDDHLTNAARQAQLYHALGWSLPRFAHIPLIHGPDGAKLSKRHGALGLEAYRAMGYLPAAMRNYLARLGWSHGDQEIFTSEELIKAFDLPQIGRSPARLDLARLDNLNGHYIRSTPDADLLSEIERVLPHIAGGAELAARMSPELKRRVLAAMPGLKERAKTLVELIEAARYVWADRPLALDDKAAGILTGEARTMLGDLAGRLSAIASWDAAATEQAVRTFAEQKGTKLGQVAQPLRAALTGRTTSPPIFDVLAVLGQDESLARLRDQI